MKPRIHEFKVLQNVFKMKKQGLKCFLKKEIRNNTLLKRDFKRLSGLYTMAGLHDLSPICAKLDFGILEKIWL